MPWHSWSGRRIAIQAGRLFEKSGDFTGLGHVYISEPYYMPGQVILSVYEELGESSRRLILMVLRSGPKNVSDIVEATGLKQPNVSNHLARMRLRGIVRASKIGRQVYYSLASDEIEEALHSAFFETQDLAEEIDWECLSKAYAKAAIQGDEPVCQAMVDRTLRAGKSMLDVYEYLLTPAMRLVGTWFKVEAIDVAQEHMASSITERMMARTVTTHGPVKGSGRVAVLGCAANGWHTIGLRMVSDYLRLVGWRSLYLGANVPLDAFVETVRQHKPELVLASCSADVSIPDTLLLLRTLRRTNGGKHGFQVGVGGASVAEHRGDFIHAGAHLTFESLRQFAEQRLRQAGGT